MARHTVRHTMKAGEAILAHRIRKIAQEPQHGADRGSSARLRSLRVLVPDVRKTEVRDQIRRDVALLAASPRDPDIDVFLDQSLRDIEGWTA